jgi:hypothetical protein
MSAEWWDRFLYVAFVVGAWEAYKWVWSNLRIVRVERTK